MRQVFRLARKIARRDVVALLVAETGTGKELLARGLHECAAERRGPFVALNCAAIPETLAAAELFGAERGAYTGADARRRGVIEQAGGGTCFLDEADSLSLAVQAQLLRVLDGHGFTRVGGDVLLYPRVRWVVAVKRPPTLLVQEGTWRDDFTYRVARVPLSLPPLRERGPDILLLALHFLARATDGAAPLALTPAAVAVLRRYPWPGNVRELAAAMERLAILHESGAVRAEDIEAVLRGWHSRLPPDADLRRALEEHDWNVTATARALGMSLATLKRRMAAAGLRRASRGSTCEWLSEPLMSRS
jgi:two-component system nitrogen regulation response regulator NtrX